MRVCTTNILNRNGDKMVTKGRYNTDDSKERANEATTLIDIKKINDA
jgi:hypothetical protein